jgi:hypothetical protein
LSNRRPIQFLNWLLATLVLCVPLTAHGQEWLAPRERHTWASFPVGSWKEVQVTTTSRLDESERTSTSITLTRSLLESVDDKGCLLRVEVTVEVDGKRFAAEPKTVRQLFGQPTLTGDRVGVQELTIEGQKFSAEVYRYVTQEDGRLTVTTVYSTPGCPPYVLRRHTVCTNEAGTMRHFETLFEVTSLSTEVEVLGQTMRAWNVRMVHTQGEDRSTIEEVHCAGIPDGVVSRVSRRQDKTGKLLEESKLELLGYDAGPPAGSSQQSGRRGFFQRRRRSP